MDEQAGDEVSGGYWQGRIDTVWARLGQTLRLLDELTGAMDEED